LTLDYLSAPPSADSPLATPWLLVLLHGWGANAQDLMGIAPYLNLAGFHLRCPDAPYPHPQVPGGRMWYGFPARYDFRSPPNFAHLSDLQRGRQQLLDWLSDLPNETQIPLQRTVLAGFSQGGAMTLDVGASLPLAAQIVLSGYAHGPLQAPVSPRPLLMVHGTFDPVVPLALAQQAQAELTALGQAVTYHEEPIAHEISLPVLGHIQQFCTDLRA